MKRVLVITGASGTGKTSVASGLARQGQVVLHADEMLSSLTREMHWLYSQNETGDNNIQQRIIGQKLELMLDMTCAALAAGNNVVVDIELSKHLTRKHWWGALANEKIHSAGGKLTTAVLTCSFDTMYERLSERGNPNDAIKVADWRNYQASLPSSDNMFDFQFDSGFFSIEQIQKMIDQLPLTAKGPESSWA